MSTILVYRNGLLEVTGQNNVGYKMSYYRTKNNKLVRTYKDDYHTALNKFKKVIDTEGF